MNNLKPKYIYLSFFLILLLQITIINPLGEFSLNDDWVHVLSIRNYVEHQTLFYPQWLSPFNYLPIILGILFSKILGFSLSLMRFLNIFIAFFTVLVFFKILDKNKIPRTQAFLISLLLWFNPIFFNLSYTFMGDMLCLLLILLAVLFYYIGFLNERVLPLLLGSLMSVLAFLTRQIGIFIMFSAGLHFLIQNKIRKKYFWISFALPALIALIIYSLLKYLQIMPGESGSHFLFAGQSYLQHIGISLWKNLLLISLFTAPLTISLIFKNKNWWRNSLLYILLIISTFLSYFGLKFGNSFVSIGNLINQTGIGPAAHVLQGDLSSWGSPLLYQGLNYFLALLLAINVFILIQYLRKRDHNKDLYFIFTFCLIYLITILSIRSFDRYLLILLPFVLFFFAQILKIYKHSRIVLLIVFIPLFLYSTIGTHNYLQWNKARWTLS